MPAQDAATRRTRAGALIRFIRYVRIGKLAPVVPTDAVVSSDVAIPRIHAPHTEQARAASAKRAAGSRRRTAHTPRAARAARAHGSAVLTRPRLARSMPKPFTHGMRRYNSMYTQPDRKPTSTPCVRARSNSLYASFRPVSLRGSHVARRRAPLHAAPRNAGIAQQALRADGARSLSLSRRRLGRRHVNAPPTPGARSHTHLHVQCGPSTQRS